MTDWRDQVADQPARERARLEAEAARMAQFLADRNAAIDSAVILLSAWLEGNESLACQFLRGLPSSITRLDDRCVYFGGKVEVGKANWSVRLLGNGLRKISYYRAGNSDAPASPRDAVERYADKVNSDPVAIRKIVTYVEAELNRLARLAE